MYVFVFVFVSFGIVFVIGFLGFNLMDVGAWIGSLGPAKFIFSSTSFLINGDIIGQCSWTCFGRFIKHLYWV